MTSFEISYEIPEIQGVESESLLRVFLKSNSPFSLGGFTLRTSFFDLELDNKKIDIDSIAGTNNFITSINTNDGVISGFSSTSSEGQSINRENKESEKIKNKKHNSL